MASDVQAPPEPDLPAPAARPWALRLVHTISQVATLVLIWWTAGVGQVYGDFFREYGMTSLPVLTEIVLKMSGVILQPGVLIVGGLAGVIVIVLGHLGFIDKALGALIVVDLLVIAFLLVGWLVGLQMPMRTILTPLSS